MSTLKKRRPAAQAVVETMSAVFEYGALLSAFLAIAMTVLTDDLAPAIVFAINGATLALLSFKD